MTTFMSGMEMPVRIDCCHRLILIRRGYHQYRGRNWGQPSRSASPLPAAGFRQFDRMSILAQSEFVPVMIDTTEKALKNDGRADFVGIPSDSSMSPAPSAAPSAAPAAPPAPH